MSATDPPPGVEAAARLAAPLAAGGADAATPAISLRTAGRTTVLQLLARVAATGCALATLAVVARRLGPEGYADWGTALSIVAMAGTVVVDPGLGTVVVRRLAGGAADGVPSPALLLRLRLGLALVAWLAITGVTVALRGADVLPLALVLGAQVLPRALLLNAGTWLQAEHRLHVQSAADTAAAALGLAGALAAAALGAGPAVLGLCAIVGPLTLVAIVLQRETRGRGGRASRSVLWDVVREALPLGAAVVLVALYTRLGFVFVNVSEAETGVAEFALAFQFVEQLVLVAGIVAGAGLPLLARRSRAHDILRDPLTARALMLVAGAGLACSVALIALAGPLVALLGGPGFEGAARLLVLLAPVAVGLLLNFFCGYLLVAVRLGHRYLAYNAVGLVVCLAGHVIFTLPGGGAAAAARVTWATDLVVAALAGAPLLRGRPRAALFVIACAAAAITASELAA